MTDINFDNIDFSKFEDDKNSQIDQKTGIDLSRFQDDPEAPARKEAFIRAQLKAQNVTPDKAVSAKNDGKTLGVDYESALNNPEIIKQRKILESQYYDELAKKYPTTALFMTDPQNHAIAQGDEENLGIFERSVKALDELGSAFGAGWRGMAAQDEGKIYFDKHILGKDLTKYDIKSHSRAGVNPTITGEQRLAQSIKDTQLYGQETKYYAKQGVAPDMMRATGYGFANLGYMAKNAVTGLFEDIEQLGKDIYENPTAAPMLVGAAATSIASKGKIDPTKALKAKDVGAKLLGADLAAFVVTDSFKQNTNEAHQLYTGVRDEEGNPMPANIAKTAAIMSGSLNASLDALQMGMITKTFSPVVQAALRKLGKKGMNEAIAEALKRKTGRDIVKKYITTAGKLVLAEGAVEGTQSIIKDTIRLIAEGNAEKQGNAKFVSPTLFEGTDKEESILARAGSDAIEAIKSTAAIGFLGASPKAFSESRLQNDIAKFEEDKAKLDAVNDAVNGTETIVRDPETISRLARSFGGDADTKQLYMDAEKTRDLFQGMDASRDPVDIVNELFGQETANRFSEALSTSTTFAVPFDAYVVKVMGTGLYEQAKEFTQLNAYSLSAEDIANFESLQQQHLDDLKRTADNIENAPSAVKQVYDDVYGQIESLNLPFLNKTDRSMFAALWAKKMATASIRKYQTPDKAYEMYDAPYKTKFVNEVSKLNDLARTRFDSTVDPLIDSLRAGTMPSDSEIYGDTLMEGLRKLGISDDRGDLKSMDVDKDLKPFTRKLLRDDGMTLDDAAQWAVDNGYIQEADINALIAAIDSDLRGSPVYNMNNPNEERLGRKQKLEELQNYFDKQGININEFSNDELKALLSGDNTLYQQEQKQIDAVRAQYEGTDQWMKSPNGKPTKLNEMQWLQVRTPNFKAWFGDWEYDAKNASKVVDENGEPLVVYHGSKADFDTFSHEFIGSNGTMEGKGFYFTDKRSIADNYGNNGKVYEVFLNIKDSLSYDSVTLNKQKLSKFIKYIDPKGEDFLSNYGDVDYEGYQKVMNQAVKSLLDGSENDVDMLHDILNSSGLNVEKYLGDIKKSLGRDGIFVENPTWGNGQKIFVAFDPTQIKSAIGNTGEFSKDNPNILYQSEKENSDLTALGEFNQKDDVYQFDNYQEREDILDRLVNQYLNDALFEGMELPTGYGKITISPSAKEGGKWQVTQWAKDGLPNSDEGIQTKEKALRMFFEQSSPQLVSKRIPIYRIDAQGFDKNIIKPHGLYVSIPSDISTFDSPHKEVGDTSFSGYATPKNPLNVDSVKIQHNRGNNYPMETSAGVSALKQLVDAKLFDSLIKADKAELTATIKEQFPDIDTSQYHDSYELLEVLGAQLAKQEGYDAIIQKVEGDPMNEMVILDNSIIGDLNSNNLNQGFQGKLTIQSNREMLVTLSGKADFSTLLHESAHLWLEMMLDDLKTSDVTQQAQNDWAVISNYFASYADKAKAEIIADHASLERDVKKLEGMKKRSPERDLELRQKTAMIEAHKKALAMIDANPDLLKEVAKDFGQSIGDNDVKNILTKPYHEQFARSMEAYFREGKAPSTDLLEAFSRFKYWLQDILYPFLKMLGVELTDDVRGVFDRMIATDAEIESVQQIQQAQRNFDAKMLKELGLTDEQIETYEKLAVAATTDAEDKLRAADMRDQLKKKTDEYKAELDAIKQEVVDELSKQPAQILLHFLRTGEFKEGTESLFPIEPTRLDTQSIIDSYGNQQLKELPRGVYGRDGKHPDIVANAFGISSGSKLMDMLINEPLNTVAKQNTYIKEEAARRMNERNPDLVSIDKLSAEAQKAIHGDKRAELLIAEMNALSKKTNKPFTPAAMLYDLAIRQFDNMHIEDINALKYLTAERKINRDIRKQIAQGDFEAALVGVQKALFNQYMYNQAVKVEEQIKDGIEAAKRYDKKAVREKIAKGGAQEYIVLQDGDKVASFPTKAEAMAYASANNELDYYENNDSTYVTTQNSYLEMIDSIRGAYSFKKVPKWLITQQDLFAKLYRAALDEGLALPFDPAQFAQPKNYTKLTLREFNDVIGALKVIEKVSNLSQGMETQYGKLDMNEVLSLMEQTVSGLKSRKVKFEHNKHFVDSALEGIDSFAAFQTTINAYVHALDGAETAGIFHDVLILPQREAFIKENKMLLVKDERVDTIFKPVYAEVDKKDVLGNARLGQSLDKLSTGDLDKVLLGNRVHLPSLNTDLSIQDIMGMAWLMGHKGGREALTHPEMVYNVTSGGLWTEENILKALEVLTPVQLKAVNDGWALYDKYWPEAQALDMRTKGYAPPKVDAIPYMVGDVAMTGGYSRLMYNKKDDLYKFRTDDDLQTMEDIVTGKGTVNQTNSGSTKARVGSGGKAPRLDFGVMDEHLGEVIHDIANREMVIQTYKLITNKRFMKIIDSKLGEAALGQFLPWVVRLAKGEPKPTSILERMVGKANNASSIMFLGLSLFNALQNATGLPVAAAMLGGKWVALGMAEFAKNPSAAVRFTMSKSGLIYVRRKTNQYSNDAKRALKTESFTGTGGDVARLAYAPQQIVQNMVDGAVWLGAYRKATAGKAQGVDPLNDAECVAFADRMIENTQSSGAIKDLSNLFARGEYMRMLTLMGSYFNMIFNMGRIRLGKRKYEPMTERFFNDAMFAIYIMVLPVLVTTMMRYEPPKEDEDLDDWATRTHFYKDLAAYPFASVVVLRSAASAYAHPEFGFNAIPSLAWGEGIFKGTLAAGKLFDSESELERKDYKAMIEGVGYAFALPTKSVYKMGEPLYDYTEGNESGVDELRVLRSMILGKPRED